MATWEEAFEKINSLSFFDLTRGVDYANPVEPKVVDRLMDVALDAEEVGFPPPTEVRSDGNGGALIYWATGLTSVRLNLSRACGDVILTLG